MKFMLSIAALSVAVLLTWTLVAPVTSIGSEAKAETEFDYIGVKKCKMCHKPAKIGNQYKVWLDSRHAGAYETLAGEAALAIGKEREIDNPQAAPECLKCHITAFPVLETIADQKITLEEGISCESCHGPGSGYKKKKTMQAIRAGSIDPADVGMMRGDAEFCVTCHNEESPTYKEFKYDEFWAKIAHSYPKAEE